MEKRLIFISFASQERDLATEVQNLINETFPFKAFVSDTTIKAGEIWQDEIVDALKEARLILVLCSPYSVTRQWINFECGAAQFLKIKIILLCHSGVTHEQLPPHMKQYESLNFHDPDFVGNLIGSISNAFKETGFKKKDSAKERYSELKHNLDKAMIKVVEGRTPEESTKEPKEFLSVSFVKERDVIWIKNVREITRNNEEEEKEWIDKIERMYSFLNKEEDKYIDTGLAIGVQNCLFDGSNIYVGVRMKATEDANDTSVRIAKGAFNTGYMLLKKEIHKEKIESENTPQDLFVSKKEIKRSVSLYKNPKICKIIGKRLEAFGAKLWQIKFEDGQPSVATIFVNNSRWFPRFEIGIWKYIDISKYHNEEMIAGFGEDLFLDYRGQENVEGIRVNYWIWAKDGKICYWSYPEERLVPRYRPTQDVEPKNAVLISAEWMRKTYGRKERFTPYASSYILNDDNVVQGQFSLPARALLSCF